MFRQDRTNPSTAVSNWRGRHDTPKAWPSTAVSTWLNGGLFGQPDSLEALESSVFGSDASSVTFTSAGSSASPWTEYQDLMIVSYARSAVAGTSAGGLTVRLNAASSTYRLQYLYGNISTATASWESNDGARLGATARAGWTANTFGGARAYLSDINSAKWKVVTGMSGVADASRGDVMQVTTLWENTDAVTSIVILDAGGGNILTGSRFDLYGLRAT